jgi:5'-deoxynucleotidase YfbR-like HD superfamily hydrolase
VIAFRTYRGRIIDLENPQPDEDISIVDIARGLSHCCRFAGQLRDFYSVAQHSVLVSTLVESNLRLSALLHDASEAYIGDLSRNLKHHPLLCGYRVIEERLQDAIYGRLTPDCILTPTGHDCIKVADDLAACWERVLLVEHHPKFHAIEDLPRLVAEGYVQTSFEDMMELTHRLPGRNFMNLWEPLPPPHAERRFLMAFGEYK